MSKRKPFFSLSCICCDGGDDMRTKAQATSLGWTGICADDGASWNYLGLCPLCRQSEAVDLLRSLARGVFCATDPSEREYQKHHKGKRYLEDQRNPKKVFKRIREIAKELHDADAAVRKYLDWRRGKKLPLSHETILVGATP